MSDAAELFLAFARPHLRRLHRVAMRYAAQDHDARDLVQETLLRAWRAFGPEDGATYRRAWLFVILRNIAAEWHRTAGRRIRLTPVDHTELTELAAEDPSETFSAFPAMDEQRFRQFLDDQLASAFDQLAAPHREVIVLSVGGDLTYREIAEVLDCPLGTVMSRAARARRALRDQLAGSENVTRRNTEVRP